MTESPELATDIHVHHMNIKRGPLFCTVLGGGGGSTDQPILCQVSVGVARDMTESRDLATDIHMPHVNINRVSTCSCYVRGWAGGGGTD